MTPAKLKLFINKFPDKPGIYIFKNSNNKPLYIGKALNLKNRLNSYLQHIAIKTAIANFTAIPRLGQMISESARLDYIQTDSDIEALILESQYIKKYRPDFNIMLRDDKQYFYVGFSNENFSKIFITHQPTKITNHKHQITNKFQIPNSKFKNKPTASHVGPFTDGVALKTTLRLLRRIFPYCTCKQLHNNYCLNYHIEKCPGFCCLKDVSSIKYLVSGMKNYRKNINSIKSILTGKKESVIKSFEREMKTLSGKQEYKKAMELQYKIEKLKRVFQNARIINKDPRTFMIYHKGSRVQKYLQNILNLPSLPRRIECYDIANIQGEHAVGAMVVFQDGVPNKNEYRRFKITNHKHQITNKFQIQNSKSQTGGDTEMLREILERRFNHPEWPFPNLIIVDGGRGQLSVAQEVIYNFQIRIFNKFPMKQLPKIVALTKNEKHIGYKIIRNDGKEILLSKLPASVKNLLLNLDSEAHRFAISYYRKLHSRSIK